MAFAIQIAPPPLPFFLTLCLLLPRQAHGSVIRNDGTEHAALRSGEQKRTDDCLRSHTPIEAETATSLRAPEWGELMFASKLVAKGRLPARFFPGPGMPTEPCGAAIFLRRIRLCCCARSSSSAASARTDILIVVAVIVSLMFARNCFRGIVSAPPQAER